MNNNDEMENLLSALRRQFLDDPEDYLEKLRELTISFKAEPQEAIETALHICHNLKGSAQAVGFTYLADLLHKVEDTLSKSKQFKLESDDFGRFDKLFSELIQKVDDYFRNLNENETDQSKYSFESTLILDKLDNILYESNPSSQPEGWGVFSEQEVASLSEKPMDLQLSQTRENATEAWGLFEVEEACEVDASINDGKKGDSSSSSNGHAQDISSSEISSEEEADLSAHEQQYLLVEHGKQVLAVHLSEVREIISHNYINPLPRPCPGLKGMIVVRDRALPVLDLEGFLKDNPSGDVDDHSCAVICESQDQSFAFCIAKARQVVSLNTKNFEPIENKGNRPGSNNLIKNVVTLSQESILILDLNDLQIV